MIPDDLVDVIHDRTVCAVGNPAWPSIPSVMHREEQLPSHPNVDHLASSFPTLSTGLEA